MKVTIVHQYFKHPREGGAIRSYYLTKGLLEKGYEVDVITAHNDANTQIRRVDGAKVFYLPVYYDNQLNKYQRIWAFLKFVFLSIGIINRIGRPNVLYVISTPLTVGVIALWGKWIKRVKYIFEIGDLWPEAPVQLGYIKGRIIKKLLYGFEKLIYRNAYRIVAMSPDIERVVARREKTRMIPNMSDCEYFKLIDKPKELLEEYNINQEFVITYLGTAGRANHLEYLLNVAMELQRRQLLVKILIAATGSELEHLRALALSNELENIIFLPYTNTAGVREILSISDAVYVSFANVPILSSGSPNKFFDGLAAGKIIITNFGGWVSYEIEQAKCGFNYNPENCEQFVEKLFPYLTDDLLKTQAKLNARKLAEDKFSRKKLISKWLQLFSE